MIYELRSYIIAPGRIADYVAAVRDVGRPIRGDDFGKLEGHWISQFGPLEQVHSLWSYTDIVERERLRDLLAQNERWMSEFITLLPKIVLVQNNQLMKPLRPFKLPAGRHVYELQTDRSLVGKSAVWIRELVAALPIRERYGTSVGVWQTTVGRLNEVLHLWAYPTLNDLDVARDALRRDAEWQTFLAATAPLLAESHAQLLRPSSIGATQ
jgi:hypothetical protein